MGISLEWVRCLGMGRSGGGGGGGRGGGGGGAGLFHRLTNISLCSWLSFGNRTQAAEQQREKVPPFTLPRWGKFPRMSRYCSQRECNR